MLLSGSRLRLVLVCAVVVSFIVRSDCAARIVKLRAGTDVKLFHEYKQNRNDLQGSLSTESKNQISSDFGTNRRSWIDRELNPHDSRSDLDNGRFGAEQRRWSQMRPASQSSTQTVSSNKPLIVRNPSDMKAADSFHHGSALLQGRDLGNSPGSFSVNRLHQSTVPFPVSLDYVKHVSSSTPTRRGGSFVKDPSTRIQTSELFFTHPQTSDSADVKQNVLASYEGLKETSSKNIMKPYLFNTIKPATDHRRQTTATSGPKVEVYNRWSHSFIHQEEPQKKHQAENVSYSVDPSSTINSIQPQPPAQLPEKGAIPEHFWPQANFSGNEALGSETPTAEHATSKQSGKLVKSLYGLRWSTNPWRPSLTDNKDSGFPSITRNRARFDKGKGHSFKVTNVYATLSPKYSFGGRRLTPTTTPEGTTAAPNVVTLDLTKTLERDGSLDKTRGYKSHKRIYSLKGFGRRTVAGERLESAKLEYDRSGLVSRGVESFNQTVEMDTRRMLSINKLMPTSDKQKRVYSLRGFLPVLKGVQGPTTQLPIVVAGYFSPQTVQNTNTEKAPFHRNPEMKAKLLNSFTSSTVKATRVTGRSRKLNESLSYQSLNVSIVRLPKRPTLIKAVTYADVLGSASFRGVTADPPQRNHSRPKVKSLSGERKLHAQIETKTDLFSDGEGSGSGGFELKYDASAENDLLDDLGNMFFKSVKVHLSRK